MFNCRRVLNPLCKILLVALMTSFSVFLVDGVRPPTARAASISTAACAGSNLVGAFVRNQAGTGHVVTTIAITNVGNTACTIGGYPGLIGIRGAQKVKLRVTGHGTYGGNLGTATLAPRMSGALIIGTGDFCAPYYGAPPAGRSYSSLIVVLPKNKGDVTVLGVALDTTCYLVESQLGWRNHFSFLEI